MKWSKNSFLEKMKRMKKEQWVVLFLAGVLILVILIPTGDSSSDTESDTDQSTIETSETKETNEEYIDSLEEKTKAFVEKMDGVGTAEVMITVKNDGNTVVDKDVTSSQSENDSNYSEETIYGNDGEDPFVVSNETPSVDGVVIICDGGDQPVVQENLIDAIEALFSIESHKIKVVKRAGGQ